MQFYSCILKLEVQVKLPSDSSLWLSNFIRDWFLIKDGIYFLQNHHIAGEVENTKDLMWAFLNFFDVNENVYFYENANRSIKREHKWKYQQNVPAFKK